MADAPVDEPSAAASHLPTRHIGEGSHAAGRDLRDWAMLVPVPASVTDDRAILDVAFGGSGALVHCLHSRRVPGDAQSPAVVPVAVELHAAVTAQVSDASVRVEPVAGQPDTVGCLVAGLAALAPEVSFVVVHDIRRPLASGDLVDRILDRLRAGDDVVYPALEVVDSVKRVDEAGAVDATVDRSQLRSLQYPRGYRRDALAAMLEGAEVTPAVVEGDPDAFVLEVPRDVALAEAIIDCRAAGRR